MSKETIYKVSYNSDPSRLDDPLDLDEVADVLNSNLKAFGKDTQKLSHFLQRTYITIQNYRYQLQLLHRDVQQAHLRSAQVGRPSSLDPATAAQYLTIEQVVERFDAHMLERLNIQKRIEQELVEARAEATRRVNAFNFAALGIFEDPDIPDSVKTKIHTALSHIPEDKTGSPTERDTGIETFKPEELTGASDQGSEIGSNSESDLEKTLFGEQEDQITKQKDRNSKEAADKTNPVDELFS